MSEYSRVKLVVGRAFRALASLSRVPQATRVDLEEVDGTSLEAVRPVFVLSTGRCGTKWLTELLRQDKSMRVNHSDYPELLRESRMAYEEYADEPRLYNEILRAARDGYLLDAARRGLAYVETNHRMTFFAYAIRKVYPGSRFVHLHRHPGEFVRSGIRRRWYSGSYLDVCRPRLNDAASWQRMSLVERLGWLWNTTNQFCEDFLHVLGDPHRSLQVRSREMFGSIDTAATVCDFSGACLSRTQIGRFVGKRINRQLTGSWPVYERWTESDRESLRRVTPLAKRYGYEL